MINDPLAQDSIFSNQNTHGEKNFFSNPSFVQNNSYGLPMPPSSAERVSGFPMPDLYNQHYINKYSFPKGLISGRKPDDLGKKQKTSIYDMHTQPVRKGVSGWKLTKRVVPQS